MADDDKWLRAAVGGFLERAGDYLAEMHNAIEDDDGRRQREALAELVVLIETLKAEYHGK